ncbi:hypothetical protein QQP08_015862 [Theobroma cacao]|nr:hypothetical protein QQP08_015862 [Theobroma cacao]
MLVVLVKLKTARESLLLETKLEELFIVIELNDNVAIYFNQSAGNVGNDREQMQLIHGNQANCSAIVQIVIKFNYELTAKELRR